jgi:hypothetical protein
VIVGEGDRETVTVVVVGEVGAIVGKVGIIVGIKVVRVKVGGYTTIEPILIKYYKTNYKVYKD